MDKAEEEINNFVNDEENIDSEDRDLSMKMYALYVKKIQIQIEEGKDPDDIEK